MFALLWVDSSTQPKISALTFHSAQTAWQNVHCVREKLKRKAKGRFQFEAAEHTHTIQKHSRIQEFSGDGCVRARFVCWSRTNTLIWMQWGVSQSASVLAGPLYSSLKELTHNPSRWTKPVMVNTRTLHGSVDRGGPKITAAFSLCFARVTKKLMPIKKQSNSVFCGVFLFPSRQWTRLTENMFH